MRSKVEKRPSTVGRYSSREKNQGPREMGEVSQLGRSGERRNFVEAVDSGFDWGIASSLGNDATRGRRPQHPRVGVSDSLALAATLNAEKSTSFG